MKVRIDDGERHSRAVLTEKEVLEIRKLYIPRVVTCNYLAEKFDVSPHAIHKIISNKSWTYLK